MASQEARGGEKGRKREEHGNALLILAVRLVLASGDMLRHSGRALEEEHQQHCAYKKRRRKKKEKI